MGRPVDADSARTWDRIVDAACAEILKSGEGAAETTLRRVAAAAGVSIGTVHYYFASKELLLEACLDGYYVRLGALARGLLAGASPLPAEPRAYVALAARHFYRFAHGERSFLQLRAATNARRGELSPERQSHVLGPFLDLAAAALCPLTRLDERQVRLTIQTMTYVVMRYALLSASELEHITGTTGAEAVALVEEHVVRTALCLVFQPA